MDKMQMTEVSPGHFVIDAGRVVICDFCSEYWTDRTESGGFIGFGSKACCPDCVPRMEALAKKYNEEDAILARCPDGKSFADWGREDLRNR